MAEIANCVERARGVTLKQLRGQSRLKQISSVRKLFILMAKEYGYKGKEIAEFIRRDPAVISIALKDLSDFEEDIEIVSRSLK